MRTGQIIHLSNKSWQQPCFVSFSDIAIGFSCNYELNNYLALQSTSERVPLYAIHKRPTYTHTDMIMYNFDMVKNVNQTVETV